MKFRKPEIYEPWSKEKTEQQIEIAEAEKMEFVREENDINSTLRYWAEEKKILQRKVSNKQKYINQLKEQIKEVDWKEV